MMEIVFRIPHPFFVFFRKQVCPTCGEPLERTKVKRTVIYGTLEAEQVCKHYGFWPQDSKRYDTVILMCYVFVCNRCVRDFSINTLYKRHKERKKQNSR